MSLKSPIAQPGQETIMNITTLFATASAHSPPPRNRQRDKRNGLLWVLALILLLAGTAPSLLAPSSVALGHFVVRDLYQVGERSLDASVSAMLTTTTVHRDVAGEGIRTVTLQIQEPLDTKSTATAFRTREVEVELVKSGLGWRPARVTEMGETAPTAAKVVTEDMFNKSVSEIMGASRLPASFGGFLLIMVLGCMSAAGARTRYVLPVATTGVMLGQLSWILGLLWLS